MDKKLFVFFLLVLSFSFSFESPPTNCKVCYGFIRKFPGKEKEQTKKIDEKCNPKAIRVFPFEDGLCEYVQNEGKTYVIKKINECITRSCIRDLCSYLSGSSCYGI